jgi:hypothetical protein
MNRAEILDAVKKTICNDRQDVHGNPEDTHALIAYFWQGYLETATVDFKKSSYDPLGMRPTLKIITAQDVAVMMCLFKIARHAMNPSHADNLHDLIGYAAIAAELGNGNA